VNRALLSGVLLMGYFAGHTAHASPLALADYKTQAKREKNAAKAARIVLRAKMKPRGIARSCQALEALGRLGLVSEPIVQALERAINQSDTADVEACGGWALGEIGTSLQWNSTSQQLHEMLLVAMNRPLEPRPAYFIVEALGKLYIPHEHSTEEDIRTAKALNSLQASYTTALPTMFYVVQGKIVNLNVAIELSRRAMAEARYGNKKELMSAYQAELTLLRQLDRKREPLLASFDQRRTIITNAFEQTVNGFALKYRPLTLVTSWYLAKIARDPLFSDLVAGSVSEQANTSNPADRLVITWSLGRMRLSRSSRTVLRDRVADETNPAVLQVLQESTMKGLRVDAMQTIYGVQTTEVDNQ
jgi:hypothetical protein